MEGGRLGGKQQKKPNAGLNKDITLSAKIRQIETKLLDFLSHATTFLFMSGCAL